MGIHPTVTNPRLHLRLGHTSGLALAQPEVPIRQHVFPPMQPRRISPLQRATVMPSSTPDCSIEYL